MASAPVAGGDSGVEFVSQNAPQQEVTWRQLLVAVGELSDFMGKYGYGLVRDLVIYSGKNEVATGSIKTTPGASKVVGGAEGM